MSSKLTVTSNCLLTDINFELENRFKERLTIDNPIETGKRQDAGSSGSHEIRQSFLLWGQLST